VCSSDLLQNQQPELLQNALAFVQGEFKDHFRSGGSLYGSTSLQCPVLSKWFVDMYTTLEYSNGHGNQQAANTANKNSLSAPSTIPQAPSVFSAPGGVRTWYSSSIPYGHAGIVLFVDEKSQTATIIHTYNGLGDPHSRIDTVPFPKENEKVLFTYLGDYMK
jgi:hypothetical protein